MWWVHNSWASQIEFFPPFYCAEYRDNRDMIRSTSHSTQFLFSFSNPLHTFELSCTHNLHLITFLNEIQFRTKAFWIVALLRKMTYNLRHSMGLWHPVPCISSHDWTNFNCARVYHNFNCARVYHNFNCARVYHDLSICVKWLIHTCAMTHPCEWHDSSMYVTWLICIYERVMAVLNCVTYWFFFPHEKTLRLLWLLN